MTAPLWLNDAGLQHLLHRVVDRLDAAAAEGRDAIRAIKVDRRSFPALYNAELEGDKERYWEWLNTLASWGWFTLKLGKVPRGQAGYECGPSLVVQDEPLLRAALGRPHRVKSKAEAWRDAVWAHLNASDAAKELVARYRLDVQDHTPEDIVDRLNRLHALTDEPLLLREVSTRLFWGLSKVLDNRQALVAAILGKACPFPEMPVQLQVYLPREGFSGVLFIENQATYERAIADREARFAGLALVFSSGFKGSARRLRTPSGASVYFAAAGALAPAATAQFLAWLFGDVQRACAFWGDLDYSGMGILAALKGSFPEMAAWPAGYQRMLVDLLQGEGHDPSWAGKENQVPVPRTGCPYADTTLLPALAAYRKFVDQEGY